MDLRICIHKNTKEVLGLTARFRVFYLAAALGCQGDKLLSFPKVVRYFVKAVHCAITNLFRRCISLKEHNEKLTKS